MNNNSGYEGDLEIALIPESFLTDIMHEELDGNGVLAEKAIVEYIDYYNNRRIKLKLNGLSPVQYRIQTVGAA